MRGIEYKNCGNNRYVLMEDGNIYNLRRWEKGQPLPAPLKWSRNPAGHREDGTIFYGQGRVTLCGRKDGRYRLTAEFAKIHWKEMFNEDLLLSYEREEMNNNEHRMEEQIQETN